MNITRNILFPDGSVHAMTFELTVEEKLNAHKEFLEEDAQTALDEFLSQSPADENYRTLTESEKSVLANRFMATHDCDIADNAQWENIIDDFLNGIF